MCVHCANNVMATDKTGTSDPYCVVFCERRRVSHRCYPLRILLFGLFLLFTNSHSNTKILWRKSTKLNKPPETVAVENTSHVFITLT